MPEIEVSQGVPLPRVKRPRASKYPFDTMEVGAHFFVPDRVTNTMTVRASAEGKRLGKRFRTRLVHMHETVEGWNLCEAVHEFAVRGVGIWREE
jgi:hypothetical protein